MPPLILHLRCDCGTDGVLLEGVVKGNEKSLVAAKTLFNGPASLSSKFLEMEWGGEWLFLLGWQQQESKSGIARNMGMTAAYKKS